MFAFQEVLFLFSFVICTIVSGMVAAYMNWELNETMLMLRGGKGKWSPEILISELQVHTRCQELIVNTN